MAHMKLIPSTTSVTCVYPVIQHTGSDRIHSPLGDSTTIKLMKPSRRRATEFLATICSQYLDEKRAYRLAVS